MTALPYPATDYTGRTCIITGANVGLGKEAARHFCRLGAEKVILACRDVEKGREAQTDINASTRRQGVVDVWELDLASFQSVKTFCHRANTELERVDIVIENAGVAIGTYVEIDGGFESSIGVNVVSTFLMAFLLLPKLRKTAMRFNVEPRLVIVSSDAHMFVSFPLFFFMLSSRVKLRDRSDFERLLFQANFTERHEKQIFESFKGKQNMSEDRYNTSKLLPIWILRELAARMSPTDAVIVNCVNPGFCRTNLFRHADFPLNYIVKLTLLGLGRDAEMGSRTLMAAATANRQSHGKYMDSCVVRDPSKLVLSQEGQELQIRIFEELVEILEGIQPNISQFLTM